MTAGAVDWELEGSMRRVPLEMFKCSHHPLAASLRHDADAMVPSYARRRLYCYIDLLCASHVLLGLHEGHSNPVQLSMLQETPLARSPLYYLRVTRLSMAMALSYRRSATGAGAGRADATHAQQKIA